MERPRFIALESLWGFDQGQWYDDRGTVYVWLDRQTDDFCHLIGLEVDIDGTVYRCFGVDTRKHTPPFLRNEVIGLRVLKNWASESTWDSLRQRMTGVSISSPAQTSAGTQRRLSVAWSVQP